MGIFNIQIAVIIYLVTLICMYCQDQYVLDVKLKNYTSTGKPNGNPKSVYFVPVYTNDISAYGVIPDCIDNGFINKQCYPGECVDLYSTNCTQCYIKSTGCFNVSVFPETQPLSHFNSNIKFQYTSSKEYLYLVVQVKEIQDTIALKLGTKAEPGEVIRINTNNSNFEPHTINTHGMRIFLQTTFTRNNRSRSSSATTSAELTTQTNVKTGFPPKSTFAEIPAELQHSITDGKAELQHSITDGKDELSHSITDGKVESSYPKYDLNNGQKTYCCWSNLGLTMTLILMNMLLNQDVS